MRLKIVTLTAEEIWFIKCAINMKNEILPLSKDALDNKIFKEDYGVSKREVNSMIAGLSKKLQ